MAEPSQGWRLPRSGKQRNAGGFAPGGSGRDRAKDGASREAGSSETPEGLRQAVPGGIGRGG